MLLTEKYLNQVVIWPKSGRHILAQADQDLVVVYQAYRPAIAKFVLAHGYLGGDFSYSRMSWIKPSFLWMMYRSGWGTKEGQEITLAIRIRRQFFESILAQAVEFCVCELHHFYTGGTAAGISCIPCAYAVGSGSSSKWRTCAASSRPARIASQNAGGFWEEGDYRSH